MCEFLCGDCLEEMRKLPDQSVDFIFTSPPYADQVKDYGTTGIRVKPNEFNAWFLPRAKEMYRLLKDNGSFVLNINDKLEGVYQSLFVFKLVILMVEKIGFHLVRDYVWYNPATPPNIFSRGTMGRTKKSHEYCFWFSKGDKWTFNMDAIRKPYSDRMQEFFVTAHQGSRAENTRPSRHNFDLSHVWKDNGGADPGTVLSISNTSSNDMFHKLCKQFHVRHPARFPVKLVEFFVLAGTNKGDVVLDPFGGSGTTAVVAHRLGRKFKYIEINNDFYNMARKWFNVEFHRDEICHENVEKFCDAILCRCKWNLLPFGFLYDLYKAWIPTNVVYQIPATKGEFIDVLLSVISRKRGWACEGKKKVISSQNMMDQPEPLILQYNLKHWMNKKAAKEDEEAICSPELKKRYCGVWKISYK